MLGRCGRALCTVASPSLGAGSPQNPRCSLLIPQAGLPMEGCLDSMHLRVQAHLFWGSRLRCPKGQLGLWSSPLFFPLLPSRRRLGRVRGAGLALPGNGLGPSDLRHRLGRTQERVRVRGKAGFIQEETGLDAGPGDDQGWAVALVQASAGGKEAQVHVGVRTGPAGRAVTSQRLGFSMFPVYELCGARFASAFGSGG